MDKDKLTPHKDSVWWKWINIILLLAVPTAILYNLVFRLYMFTGYLSSSVALICGVLCLIAWYQQTKQTLLLPICSNKSINPVHFDKHDIINSVKNAYLLNSDKPRLFLNIGVVVVCFVNFLCYLIICCIVATGKDEYISCLLWYLLTLPVSLLLVYQQLFIPQTFVTPNNNNSTHNTIIRISVGIKWFTVGLLYLLFVFTMFDSGFRANIYAKYYVNADMHTVLDTRLQFDCFCGGDGVQRPFRTCLQMHRAKYSDDRVMIVEHGVGSSSYTHRSLLRYLSRNVASFTFCAYSRRMHGLSDRLSWSQLQLYTDVSDNVYYFMRWLMSQNLNSPIVYAGHSYGAFHVAYLAMQFPSLVKSLVIIDGSLISGKVSFLAGSTMGWPPHIPNINGLVTGLPLLIASGLSYESFLAVSGQQSNDDLAFDPQDFPEVLASLGSLNFYEILTRELFIGLANSDIMLTYSLVSFRDNNQIAIKQPTLVVYDATDVTNRIKHEREMANPTFFANISYVPIFNTSHTGIVTRQWKETGDAIIKFIAV